MKKRSFEDLEKRKNELLKLILEYVAQKRTATPHEAQMISMKIAKARHELDEVIRLSMGGRRKPTANEMDALRKDKFYRSRLPISILEELLPMYEYLEERGDEHHLQEFLRKEAFELTISVEDLHIELILHQTNKNILQLRKVQREAEEQALQKKVSNPHGITLQDLFGEERSARTKIKQSGAWVNDLFNAIEGSSGPIIWE